MPIVGTKPRLAADVIDFDVQTVHAVECALTALNRSLERARFHGDTQEYFIPLNRKTGKTAKNNNNKTNKSKTTTIITKAFNLHPLFSAQVWASD